MPPPEPTAARTSESAPVRGQSTAEAALTAAVNNKIDVLSHYAQAHGISVTPFAEASARIRQFVADAMLPDTARGPQIRKAAQAAGRDDVVHAIDQEQAFADAAYAHGVANQLPVPKKGYNGISPDTWQFVGQRVPDPSTPATPTTGNFAGVETMPTSEVSDAGPSGSDLPVAARDERGRVPDAGRFDEPDHGNAAPAIAGGGSGLKPNNGLGKSGAQLEAEQLLAEAKAKAALKSGALNDAESLAASEPASKLMRPFPNVPYDAEGATRKDILRDSRVFYRPGVQGRQGILYANPQAREILSYVGGATDDHRFSGMWMNRPLVKAVTRKIDRALVTNQFGMAAVKPLFEIRKALSASLKDNGDAVFVDAGPGQTLSDVKATIRHELHHAYEQDFTPEQASQFLDNPVAHKAGRTLVDDLGYQDDPVNLVSEIAAHIQGDPTGSALDLTPEQAHFLFRQYVRNYPGVFSFERMHPTLKKIANEEIPSKGRTPDVGQ